MASLSQALHRILHGTAHAFIRYPLALFSAFLLAASASVRVALEKIPNDFVRLLDSLQWTLLFIAFLGLPLAFWGICQSRPALKFWLIHLGGLLVGSGIFIFLITRPQDPLTPLIQARLVIGSIVSLFFFMLGVGRRRELNGFSQALFLTLKSIVIAMLYALVILLGLFFITFAIESLIYENLASDTYLHISIWSSFAGFALFLGGIPSLNRQQRPEEFRRAAAVPRFMEILFLYVFIPLLTLLSLVLLVWTVQILMAGDWPSFTQLSVIFSVYTLFGILLALLIDPLKKPLGEIFTRFFPFAALVFLSFFTYALVLQLQSHGLKTSEYVAALIILFAAASAFIFLLRPKRPSEAIAVLVILVFILSVLPVLGYLALPARAQAYRLRSHLQDHDLWNQEEGILAASSDLALSDQEAIADAAFFLLDTPSDHVPEWFSQSITQPDQFEQVFGFAPVYPDRPDPVLDTDMVFLFLPAGHLDIERYHTVHIPEQWLHRQENILNISGKHGDYELIFSFEPRPGLYVKENEVVLLDYDFSEAFADLFSRYHMTEDPGRTTGSFSDLSLTVTAADLKITILFESIEIYREAGSTFQYNYRVHSLYLAD